MLNVDQIVLEVNGMFTGMVRVLGSSVLGLGEKIVVDYRN